MNPEIVRPNLGALGLAVVPRHAEAKEAVSVPKAADTFVPENNYPTFADEPDSKPGEPS